MADVVLDASAVLAVLADEKGADSVRDAIVGASLSAVNASEVIGKLIDRGASAEQANAIIARLPVRIDVFGREDAEVAGALRAATRHLGLSLGDRACLALAKRLGWPVLTTDRDMAAAVCGVTIRRIR